MGESAQLAATSGFGAYYISPPRILHPALIDPIHTVLYILSMTFVCAIFSKTWIEVSGSGPRDIAKQLKGQQLVRPSFLFAFFFRLFSQCPQVMVAHHEGSMYKEFKRVIPPVARAIGRATLGSPLT
jgi:protein transport protein SEC61 subunit alpha